ncbi:hypothetical protein NUU61_006483 [Penicillium alfredii]|uniref:Uncharacterized protein n=1 Tax=Penicillium alfredii TaxID=1506179 RepID=A0A9W9F0X3_9EURO|nr:uncharacterized protein NUU61_006483 [Penicillium alfredii]KAJ5091613.1 hypothetical protein NUU61_006483 [Penicillium alfredii]
MRTDLGRVCISDRHELQWARDLFFSASILAGAVSGPLSTPAHEGFLTLDGPWLLAYALGEMDGIAGYGGRRWIFIIEGLVTVVAAIVA